MPGPKCNVRFCLSQNGKCNDAGEKITYHRFPKKTELRNEWLRRCQKFGNWNVDYGYVCSEHFKKDDFIRNLQAELLCYKGRKKLKPFAIPSMNLPRGIKIIDISPSTNKIPINEGGMDKLQKLINECILTTEQEIPLSYEIFKKRYKKCNVNSIHGFSNPSLVSLENPNNIHGLCEERTSFSSSISKNLTREQINTNNKLKRNETIQKIMMKKLFLATLFDETFSENNHLNYIVEEYDEKTRSALIGVCALSPKSYDKFAKKLNFPTKDVLTIWSNKNYVINT